MKRIWNYALNTFINATKTSFKKMLGLISYHIAALQAEIADADILALFNSSKTEADNFKSNYAIWKGAKADFAGEAQRFNEWLEMLSEKLNDWDIEIQRFFKERTAEYKSIFSKGKSIFYLGTQDQKVSELDTLMLQLAKYPSLADVLASVNAYNNTLRELKDSKDRLLEKADKASSELEKSRLVVAKLMYRNLGMLMYKFFEKPEDIERFYDLELLRRHIIIENGEENKPYLVIVEPKTTIEAGISFEENAKFSLYNNSNATVGVYAAAENPATAPTQMLILEPEDEKITSLAELNGQNCRFLFFVNQDEHEEAEIEITLIEE